MRIRWNKAILLNFVKQSAVADAEQARRRFPVPVGFLKRVRDSAALRLALRAPGQGLQGRLFVRSDVAMLQAFVPISVCVAVRGFRSRMRIQFLDRGSLVAK